MEITNINIVFPDVEERHLKIAVGACRLQIKPGDGDAWVSGTYQDPSNSLPLKIVKEGGTVKITQQYNPADLVRAFSGPPQLDLTLGNARNYAMTLESGASDSSIELGGLPITRMILKSGASKSLINFSAPNPQPMAAFNLSAGAGMWEVKNLANANTADIRIEGGAATYIFDLGGDLKQDAHAKITTGVSSVELDVPESTAAKIAVESTMGSLDVGDGFTKKEGAFWTEAAVAGKTPVVLIQTSVAIGSLRLRAY